MSAGRDKIAAARPADVQQWWVAPRSWPFWWDKIDVVFFLVIAFYTLTCPFTKVEESFQTQATHDMLVHGANLDAYDHNEFPGVVPRSFVAPLLLAIPTYVFHHFVWFFWAYVFPLVAPAVSAVISMLPFPSAVIADAWDAEVFLGARVFLFSLPPAPVPLGALFPAASSWAARLLPAAVLPSALSVLGAALPIPPAELVTLSRGISIPALRADSLWLLIAARLVLAAASVTCWACLRAALRARCDPFFAGRLPSFLRPSALLGLVACTVFHLPFYASRPIANVFATNVVALAVAAFLLSRSRLSVAALAAATIILRCDLVIYAPFFLGIGICAWFVSDASGRAHFARSSLSPFLGLPLADVFVGGIVSTVLSVALTVGVDSYFWRRAWTWPELEVLLFNTVENKSHLWGTAPWYWYFIVALPRLCLYAAPAMLLLPVSRTCLASWFRLACCRCGVRTRSAAPPTLVGTSPRAVALLLIAPAVMFVAAYSFLPHKELRFLFPALPALYSAGAIAVALVLTAYYDANAATTAVSAAASSVPPQAPRLTLRARAGLVVAATLLVLAVVVGSSGASWAAAVQNYPGGHGLVGLNAAVAAAHARAPYTSAVAVHLSNLACTTGAARFGQVSAQAGGAPKSLRVVYYKTEGIEAAELAQYPPAAPDSGKLQWLLAESRPYTIRGFDHVLAAKSKTPTQFSLFKDVIVARKSQPEDREWVLRAQALLGTAREAATRAAQKYAGRVVAQLPPLIAPRVEFALSFAGAVIDLLCEAAAQIGGSFVTAVRVKYGAFTCAGPVEKVLTWEDAPGGSVKLCVAGAEIAISSPGFSFTTEPALYLQQRGSAGHK